jgi:hypothetical protein
VTYTVVGWHHDPGLDPLRHQAADFGWTLTPPKPAPERTLYFGAIRAVPLDADAPPDIPLKPTLALGNTPAEALAALAARAEAEAPANRSLQRLFNAFQIGALRRLTDLAGLEEQVHAASFASVDAGTLWELRPQRGDTLPAVAPEATTHLSRLNRTQRELDVLRAEQTTLRRRIFADWCRRAELRAARWSPGFDLDALEALIDAQIDRLDEREQEAARLRGAIDFERRSVRFHLPVDVELVAGAAPRYYRPNDPVVVLAGKGIPDVAPDIAETVACARGPLTAPGFDELTALPHPEAGPLAWLGAFGEGANGLPEPEIALRTWEAPWRPVELAWRVALQVPHELATREPLPERVVLANQSLHDRTLDFEPSDDAFDSLADTFEGRALLAANATAALERQLEGLIDDELLARLRKTPLVAQSLGGFTQALAMLDQRLQLPVAEPDGAPLDAAFARRVADAVGEEARFGPLPDNPFTPLRCGRFELSALRLVDEFGRWRDVDTEGLIVSETITRRGRAWLPPLRLTQAAQLRWRWRIGGHAATDASNAPDGSPICGWVVTNRLDNGIIVYDHDGRGLARFAPGRPPETRPGHGRPDDLEAALAGVNPVVAGLARSFAGRAPDQLRALTEALEASRDSIAPPLTSADREIAVLLGTPLAVVQAELDLSLLGLPLIDMSYAALRDELASGDPVRRADRALTAVRFGVRLGNLTRADDGLAGFYLAGDGGTPDFGTFYAATGADGDSIQAPTQETVTVSADPGSAPVVVTMLVDPRCHVHAATGILPVKALTIPGDLVTRSLAELEYTFLTGPLIVPGNAFCAPAPAAPGGWSWVDRGGRGGEWREDRLGAMDAGLPPTGRQRIVDGWMRLNRKEDR